MSILKGGPQTVNYLSFDGTNDYAFASQSLFDLYTSNTTKEIEIDFEVKSFVTTNSSQFILYSNATNNIRTYVYISTANEISIQLGNTEISTNVIPNLNQIYNIRVVHDNNNVTVYLDDVIVIDNQPWIIDTLSVNQGITLGSTFNGGAYANVNLYYLKITNNGSLFLEYNFDEGSGTTLNDSAGNNDATINGATWQTETVSPAIQNIYYGQPTNYLSFDGSNDYVNTNYSPPGGNNERTFEIIFEYLPNANGTLISYGSSSDNQNFNVNIENDGIVGRFKGGSISVHNNLIPNTIYHLAVVVPNGASTFGDIIFYIDGISENGSNNNPILTTSNDLFLGSQKSPQQRYIEVNIYEFRAWNDERTSTEINNNLNRGDIVGTENNLDLLYLFDEGSGTALNDSSGNGNDATIVGATWVSEPNEVSRVYLGSSLVYGEPLPFELGTVTYDNVNFSVASQDGGPSGLTFNNDGTKMFILGSVNDNVYQYTLTTPFDVGTASYDNVSFNVTSQDSVPLALTFNNDGSKMFMVGRSSDSVHQYNLSTAFNVATASYDNVSFNVSSQDGLAYGLTFNNEGTKMFIVGVISDRVHQYTLSTAFDIATASYDNVSFSVLSQESTPLSLAFNNDGSKMFIVGSSSDSVHQYTLSTPFDVGTASYDNVSFSVSSQDNNPADIRFNNDGTKMFIVGSISDSVHQYTNNF